MQLHSRPLQLENEDARIGPFEARADPVAFHGGGNDGRQFKHDLVPYSPGLAGAGTRRIDDGINCCANGSTPALKDTLPSLDARRGSGATPTEFSVPCFPRRKPGFFCTPRASAPRFTRAATQSELQTPNAARCKGLAQASTFGRRLRTQPKGSASTDSRACQLPRRGATGLAHAASAGEDREAAGSAPSAASARRTSSTPSGDNGACGGSGGPTA